ncbi:zinc-binding dehydrogenase [Rhodobacteraceae bacterium 2CG4]|uniref:Zinc-binding dehydrogenase n=1 Tax=Halovulum marinum TaxID=2662447 RepID=A0A6L5Z5T9_9RHOB|nr:NAD(P)-dependent alcohol dehydrogenase [Halovulum marinum]MSU91362.1 zinc-binding dehydrogenase [Halovulum marinum]
MKAAWHDRYGTADVLRIRDIDRPRIGDDEILVKVHASAVTTADWRLRASAFPAAFWLPGRLAFGLLRPKAKVLGAAFSGTVAARGANATGFADGQAVFGHAGAGAHAEYLAIGRDAPVLPRPEGLDHAQAAAVPFGALSALVFLRDMARLQPGQTILIAGATGDVGVWAVQLARHMGAEVTALASADKHALVRGLGAHHAIDYRRQDVSRGAARYDVILDTVGATRFRDARRALAPTGRWVALEFGLREVWQALWSGIAGGRRAVIGVSGDSRADLAELAELLARGAIRPVIDATFPLSRIAEAHRRVESRRKTGAVVLTVAEAAALAAE